MNSKPVQTFIVLVVVLVLAALDQTITSTALPTITRELSGQGQASWVFSCYLIASTVAIPVYGRLADLRGSRSVIGVAIALFAVGSALCGVSQSMNQMLAARVVQGAGAGGLLTLTMVVTAELFAPQLRGRYLGLLGSAYGLATVIGPLAGGLLVQHLSWRWAFLINIPIAVPALLIFLHLYRGTPRVRIGSIDYVGAVLLIAGLSSALLLTKRGFEALRSISALLALIAATAAFMAAFVVWERRQASPLLPMALFASRQVLAANVLSAISGIALFAGVVFLPLFLQIGQGLTPLVAAVHMLPLMLSITVASIAGGKLLARGTSMRAIALLSTLASAAGYVALPSALQAMGHPSMWACMVVIGTGIGLLFPLITVIAQRSVAPQLIGTSTAATVMFRSVGGALGVSALGSLFSHLVQASLNTSAPEAATNGRNVAATLEAAFAHALAPVFYVVAAISALACLVAWALPKRAAATQEATVRAG